MKTLYKKSLKRQKTNVWAPNSTKRQCWDQLHWKG